MRYSQLRSDARRSKRSSPRQAASIVSWEHVLSVLHRSEQAVAVQLQLAPVGLGEPAERLLVAAGGLIEQRLCHRLAP